MKKKDEKNAASISEQLPLFMGIAAVALNAAILFSLILPTQKKFENDFIVKVQTIARTLIYNATPLVVKNDIISLKQSIEMIMSQSSLSNQIAGIQIIDPYGKLIVNDEWNNALFSGNKERYELLLKSSPEAISDDINKMGSRELTEQIEQVRKQNSSSKQIIVEQERMKAITLKNNSPFFLMEVPSLIYNTNWGAVRIFFINPIPRNKKTTWGIFILFALISTSTFIGYGFALRSKSNREYHSKLLINETTLNKQWRERIEKIKTEGGNDGAGGGSYDLSRTPSTQEFYSVLDASKTLHSSLDSKELLPLGIKLITRILKVYDVSVFLVDKEQQLLYGAAGADRSGTLDPSTLQSIQIPIGQGDIGRVTQFGTTALIDEPTPGAGVVSSLQCRGEIFGAILIRNKMNERPFFKKDQVLLRLFSASWGNALGNAYYLESLWTNYAEGTEA